MKKFCVISKNAGRGGSCDRTWFEEVEDGVMHASRLMAGDDKINELYVVQIVKIVERPLPTVSVRDPD